MTKTSPIPDDAHEIVRNQQRELKRKYKIIVRISDLIAMYIKYGAERTEKLLGIKSEKEKIEESGTDKYVDHKDDKCPKPPGIKSIDDENVET